MREIEFRAIDYVNELQYGSLVIEEYLDVEKGSPTLGHYIPHYFIRTKDKNDWTSSYRNIPINPETIGQYTELKDRNGKKIFEGDIIKHKTNETLNGKPIHIYYCINYCGTEKCLRAFKNGLTGYAYQISFASYIIKEQDLEVVGNIYERPEFLTHQHEDKGE